MGESYDLFPYEGMTLVHPLYNGQQSRFRCGRHNAFAPLAYPRRVRSPGSRPQQPFLPVLPVELYPCYRIAVCQGVVFCSVLAR